MQTQTWQIQQQLQRVQQLCTQTVQINQQAVQELQQINQQVGQLTNVTNVPLSGGVGSFQQPQPGYYGYASNTSLNAVMQADRQSAIQENSPSYRNYNTQAPQYSPAQSANYGAQSYGSFAGSAPIQSVMMADQQATMGPSRAQYGSVGTSVGNYSSSMM